MNTKTQSICTLYFLSVVIKKCQCNFFAIFKSLIILLTGGGEDTIWTDVGTTGRGTRGIAATKERGNQKGK